MKVWHEGWQIEASPIFSILTIFLPLQQESKEEPGLQKKRKQQLDGAKLSAKRKFLRRSHVLGKEDLENEQCTRDFSLYPAIICVL